MKVQNSSISKEMKVKTPEAFAQSRKIWKKRSFNSWIDLPFPSKVRAFLSHQMTHTRQWRIILQSTLVLSSLNLPDQLAISSTTPCTWPNEPQIVNTSYPTTLELLGSVGASDQWSPHSSCTCNTNPPPPLFTSSNY